MVIQRREKNKIQEKQEMHNTIAHPVPTLSRLTAPSLCPGHDMLWFGISLWLFGSAVLSIFPPGFSCTCSLVKRGKLESPGSRVSTT